MMAGGLMQRFQTPSDRSQDVSPRAASTGDGANPLRVLVVDDNVDSARVLAMFLSLKGLEVDTRYDGQAALDAAVRQHPDAIVMDLGLPKLSGFEVAERLRNEEQFQNTKLIAVSGYGNDEARERSEQAGFDHHLTKPVDTLALLALIEAS